MSIRPGSRVMPEQVDAARAPRGRHRPRGRPRRSCRRGSPAAGCPPVCRCAHPVLCAAVRTVCPARARWPAQGRRWRRRRSAGGERDAWRGLRRRCASLADPSPMAAARVRSATLRSARGSAHLAEGQAEALPADHGMVTGFHRQHAMETQAVGPAPDHDIAMHQRGAYRLVAAREAAEQEGRGQPQRDRTDGATRSSPSRSWCRDRRVPGA